MRLGVFVEDVNRIVVEKFSAMVERWTTTAKGVRL